MIMQKFAVIALFFLFACNQAPVDAVEKPSDLIPEEKMVQVLVDVHLLEATLNVRTPQVTRTQSPLPLEMPRDTIIKGVVFDPKAPPPIAWYDIFKKHGVTKTQYEASMKWYSSQPEELNKIYDEVINALTTQQVKDKAGK
jgi:hypothetical protein